MLDQLDTVSRKKLEGVSKAISKELEVVREINGGILRREDVVEYAKNPKTELNKHFLWDDTEAAEKFRLMQASQLIRICTVVIPYQGGSSKVRAYVSLPSDRKTDPGVYRALNTVISDEDKKLELMQMALDELKAFKAKYDALRKVVGMEEVFEVLDKIFSKEKEDVEAKKKKDREQPTEQPRT